MEIKVEGKHLVFQHSAPTTVGFGVVEGDEIVRIRMRSSVAAEAKCTELRDALALEQDERNEEFEEEADELDTLVEEILTACESVKELRTRLTRIADR